MFSEELELLRFSDDEKQVIYSVAMRPNIDIQRKNINGEAAMCFYTEETVQDLQQNFFKNNSHNGATINHDGQIRNDIYAFESWIVENPEHDKATLLGMEVEKGDWILGQKVDNNETWQKVKSGELQGFSIEAYLEPILTNTNIQMTKEEVKAMMLEIQMEDEASKAAKLKEEEDAKLAMAEAPIVEEEPKDDEPKEDLQSKVDELMAENNELKAKLAEYEAKEVSMSEELETAKKQVLEFSEQIEKGLKPDSTPAKSYEEMSNYEKAKYNRGQL
jgi:hypothetical protein